MTSRLRIHELDLLRFLAAMSVVIFHLSFRGAAADGYASVAYPVWDVVSRYGYLGVDLFFMISGFVILLSTEGKSIVDFVVSRMVRLYPAYWICVTLTAVVVAIWGYGPMTVTLPQYFANLTMIQYFLDSWHVDGVYWSLVVELRFYFLIFIGMALGLAGHWLSVLALWLLAVIVMRLMPDLAPPLVEFLLIQEWASYFIAGAAFYLVRRDGWKWARMLVILVACGLSIDLSIERAIGIGNYYETPIDPVVNTVIVLSFHLIFVLIASNSLPWLNRPSFVTIGALTYPLYLIHQNIGYILIENLAPYINKQIVLLGVIAAMTIASYIIYRFGERPISAQLKTMIKSIRQISHQFFTRWAVIRVGR